MARRMLQPCLNGVCDDYATTLVAVLVVAMHPLPPLAYLKTFLQVPKNLHQRDGIRHREDQIFYDHVVAAVVHLDDDGSMITCHDECPLTPAMSAK